MAKTLIPIPNQPLRFMDYNEVRFCEKPDPYCYLHEGDDPIRAQFRQIPCGDNIVCNPDFSTGSVSAELVTNGSFTGSASGWLFTGSGWAYNSNNVKYTGNVGGAIAQTVAITAGKKYILSFTISNLTFGNLYIDLAGISTYINANGSYALTIQAGTDAAKRLSFLSIAQGII